MPTRIFFTNGEQVTVSASPDEVASLLSGGGLAKLERPWGDESIFVNPTSVQYIEAQDERAPDIAALEAVAEAGAPPSAPPAGGPPAGGPPPQAGQPGAPAGGQFPPR